MDITRLGIREDTESAIDTHVSFFVFILILIMPITICINCGKQNQSENNFCVYCGNTLNGEENTVAKPLSGGLTVEQIINLGIIIIPILLVLFFFITSNKNDNKTSEAPPVPLSVLAEQKKASTLFCPTGNVNDLVFVSNQYKLSDIFEIDTDIKPLSNEMKLYGIIRNKSIICSVKNILLEVTLSDKITGEVIQRETRKLTDSSLLRIPVTIASNSTSDFSEKINVYESLLINKYSSASLITGKLLRDGIVLQTRIVDAEWNKNVVDFSVFMHS